MRWKGILVVIVILMGLFGLSSFVNAIANGTIELNQSVYDGNDQPAAIVFDLGLNTSGAPSQDYVNITINSTTNGTGFTFTLNETTNVSGLFNYSSYGFALNVSNVADTITLNFSTATGSTDNYTGVLQISAGDHIWVTYVGGGGYTNTTVAVIEETGTNNVTVGGTTLFAFNNTMTTAAGITFNVDDMGRNTDVTSVNNVNVIVTNVRLAQSVTIRLNESGADTGLFNVFTNDTGDQPDEVDYRFDFTDSLTTLDTLNRLKVAAGDKINISYDDNQNFGGSDPVNVVDLVWMDMDGVLNHTPQNCGASAVLVWVNDTGRDVDESVRDQVTINLVAGTTGDMIQVTLNESDVNAGFFNRSLNSSGDVRDISFSCVSGQTSNDTLTLSVQETEVINVTYDDNQNFSGQDPPITWRTLQVYDNGTVSLDRVLTSYTNNSVPIVTVNDQDNNTNPSVADQLNVVINSTSWPTGFTVTLNESGVNTGIFNISHNSSGVRYDINITTGAGDASINRLNVSAGDWVYVTYVDVNPSATRTTQARVETDASVGLDASIYDTTSNFVITVTDNGTNVNSSKIDNLSVTINSTSWPSGFSINLNESGADTGLFNRTANGLTLNLTTSAGNASSNLLNVSEGDKIWVAFSDTQFSGASVSVVGASNISSTATITLSATSYTNTSVPIVTVTDADNNTNPSVADQLNVVINSTSWPTGFTVTLNESGVNTGIFNISHNSSGVRYDINITTGAGDASINRLNVSAGDWVYVTYVDADPSATRTTQARVETDAVVTLNASIYDTSEYFSVTVTDNGTNVNSSKIESVTVTINSTSWPTGFSVTLNESYSNGTSDSNTVDTGIFATPANGITLNLTTAAGDSSKNTLNVSEGDKIWVAFSDTQFSGASASVVGASNISTTGTVALGANVYSFNADPVLTITDPDLNTDNNTMQQINITLNSTTDGTGITITLNESSVDSSIFNLTVNWTGANATLNLTNEASSLNASGGTEYKLNVSAGDTIWLAYTDARPSGTRVTTARMEQTGTMTLDETSYPSSGTPIITVTDNGLNTDSSSINAVNVTLNSTSWPTGLTVQLNESGVDTGVFNVSDVAISFTTTGAGSDATNTLNVSAGGRIWALYQDSSNSGGSAANVTDTAVLYVTATISLDRSYYNSSNNPLLTINDADKNLDTTGVEVVSFKLYGDSDTTGITVYLNESGVDSGVFNITVNSSGASQSIDFAVASDESVNDLQYAEGDSFVVKYQDDNQTSGVVTGVSANISTYATINLQVTTRLEGWNQFSVPYTLATGYNNYSTVIGSGSVAPVIAYYYDASSSSWTQVLGSDTLVPLRGYWLSMNTSSVTYTMSPVVGGTARTPSLAGSLQVNIVSLSLTTGYNFIGLNYVATTSSNESLDTLEGGGSNPWYWNHYYEYDTDQGIPTMVRASDGNGNEKGGDMQKGRGYWIYMNTAGTYKGLQTR